ncbi:hypothetical protein D9M68_550760 [compost metagenome]
MRCRPRRTFSSSVRCGNTAEIWNERITPRRAICAGRSPVMSWPLNRIVPAVGSRNLVSRLKQVVLPAPLGPMSAWIEPRFTERSTLLTAVNPLNSLVSWRVSRMTSLISRRRPCAEKRNRSCGPSQCATIERGPIVGGCYAIAYWGKCLCCTATIHRVRPLCASDCRPDDIAHRSTHTCERAMHARAPS